MQHDFAPNSRFPSTCLSRGNAQAIVRRAIGGIAQPWKRMQVSPCNTAANASCAIRLAARCVHADHGAHRIIMIDEVVRTKQSQKRPFCSTWSSSVTDQGISLAQWHMFSFFWSPLGWGCPMLYTTVPVVRNSRMVPARPRIGLDNLCGVLWIRYLPAADGTLYSAQHEMALEHSTSSIHPRAAEVTPYCATLFTGIIM